jgi:hypothetical protein
MLIVVCGSAVAGPVETVATISGASSAVARRPMRNFCFSMEMVLPR